MSLSKLRDQLRDQADEIDINEPIPLIAVRGRAARLRRRRMAAVAAGGTAVALVVAVAVGKSLHTEVDGVQPAKTATVVPSATVASPSDGLPSRRVAPAKGDYLKEGVRYRAVVAGDTLQAAGIGSAGQSSISFRWTPATTQVDFRIFCTIDDRQAQDIGKVVLRINGKQFGTESCDEFQDPEPGERAVARLPAKDLGLRVGHAVQVTASIVDGNGRLLNRPGQLVGAGIYSRSQDRECGSRDPIYLPERIQHHGLTYQLEHSLITAPVRSDVYQQDLAMPTPGFKPFLLMFGTIGVRQNHSFEIAGVAGGEAFDIRPVDGRTNSIKFDSVAAQAAGEVILRQTAGNPARGDLVLAIYLPVS
jgi:hypothetical protein